MQEDPTLRSNSANQGPTLSGVPAHQTGIGRKLFAATALAMAAAVAYCSLRDEQTAEKSAPKTLVEKTMPLSREFLLVTTSSQLLDNNLNRTGITLNAGSCVQVYTSFNPDSERGDYRLVSTFEKDGYSRSGYIKKSAMKWAADSMSEVECFVFIKK